MIDFHGLSALCEAVSALMMKRIGGAISMLEMIMGFIKDHPIMSATFAYYVYNYIQERKGGAGK